MNMSTKDKELRLIDLCARLPYGVKVFNSTFATPTVETLLGRMSDDTFVMRETYKEVSGDDFRTVRDGVNYTGHIEDIKPYLRSLKSMTEEEKKEIEKITNNSFYANSNYIANFKPQTYGSWHGNWHDASYNYPVTNVVCNRLISWLDKKHFDHRTDEEGKTLIEKGLAIEVTGENNPDK